MVFRGIVDPDKPLPSELGKEYWETAAKLILEFFYPKRFVDLSVDGERPDLRNGSIGVEVTCAEGQIDHEISSLHSRNYTYGDEKQREKAARQIKKLGGVIQDGFLLHPTRNRDFKLIYSSVNEKTRKLNDNYQLFNENDLFIYSEDFILDEELSDILKSIVNEMSGFGRIFDFVFLCSKVGDLCEFNIKDYSYKRIQNSHDDIQRLAIDARKIIDKKYSTENR